MSNLNTPQSGTGGSNNNTRSSSIRDDVNSAIFDELNQAHQKFIKLGDQARQRYSAGTNGDWFEMFRNYVANEYGQDLLKEVDAKRVKVTLSGIKDIGYGFDDFMDTTRASQLHIEYQSASNEAGIIQSALTDLKTYLNGLGDPKFQNTFSDFAVYANFDANRCTLRANGRIKNIEDVSKEWDTFISMSRTITLLNGAQTTTSWNREFSFNQKNTTVEKIENACANFDLTEKMMMQAWIDKVSSTLQGQHKIDFDTVFTPLHALTGSIFSFTQLQSEWNLFLQNYGPLPLASTNALRSIKITINDMKNALQRRGIVNNNSFAGELSSWGDRFSSMFGKIVTNRSFEQLEKSKEFYETTLSHVADVFKKFPPYINDLTKIFPYDEAAINADPSLYDMKNEIVAQKAIIRDDSKPEMEKMMAKAKVGELELAINEQKWRLYADTVTTQDAVLGAIVKKLIDNKFNFESLSTSEQNTLTKVLGDKHLKDIRDNHVLEYLGIPQANFDQMLKNILEVDKDSVTLTTPGGQVTLNFDEKKLLGGGYDRLPEVGQFSQFKNMPLHLTFKAEPETIDFFEKSDLWDDDNGLFYNIDGQKIAQSYKVTLVAPDGTRLGPGYLGPVGAGGNGNSTELYFYTEPLNYLAPHKTRKQIFHKGQPVVFDDKNGPNYRVEVKQEDKKISINGGHIGRLLLAGVTGEAHQSRPEISADEKKRLEQKLGVGFTGFQDTQRNNPEDVGFDIAKEADESENTGDASVSEGSLSSQEKFLHAFKELKGYDGDFQEGVSFVLDVSKQIKSKYPGNARTRLEMKVTDIQGDRMLVRMGNAGYPLGGLDGSEQWFPMTEQTIQKWRDNFGDTGIFTVGPRDGGPNDKKYKDQLTCLDNSKQNFPALKVFKEKVDFKKSKFILKQNKDEVIRYFESEDMKCEVTSQSGGKLKVNMKFEGLDDNSKDTKYDHTEIMDYYHFLMLVAEQGLFPKTDAEKAKSEQLEEEAAKASGKNSNKQKRKWYTIGDLIANGKKTIEKIKETKKANRDSRREDLMDHMISDWGLYKGMARILPGELGAAAGDMHREHIVKRDERAKGKIEFWKNYFTADPDFAKTYREDIKPMLVAKDGSDRFKVAGALLAMISKGGPYMSGDVKKGDWIEMLYGKEVRKIYNFKYDEKVAQMKQSYVPPGEATKGEHFNDELVKFEMNFIIDQLTKGGLLISPEFHTAKARELSKWFGTELSSTYDELVSKSRFEKKYEEVGNIPFGTAEKEFKKFLGYGQPQQAFPFLKRMADLNRKPEHYAKIIMHLSASMLSGLFRNDVTVDYRKIFQKYAASLGFPPGLWLRDFHHQEKIHSFLDLATDGAFTKETGYRPENFQDSDLTKSKEFHDEFEKFWRRYSEKILDMMDTSNPALHDKLENGTDDEKKAAKDFLAKMADSSGMDKDVSGNPANYLQQGSFNQQLAFVSEHMAIHDGAFKQGDLSDYFWKIGVAKKIPQNDLSNNPAYMKYVGKTFFNYFGDIITPRVFIRTLATAKANPNEASDFLEFMIKGIFVKHFRCQLPDSFEEALEAFKQFWLKNLKNLTGADIKAMAGGTADEDFGDPYLYGDMDRFQYLNDVSLPPGDKYDALRAEKREMNDSNIYINYDLSKINDFLNERQLKINNKILFKRKKVIGQQAGQDDIEEKNNEAKVIQMQKEKGNNVTGAVEWFQMAA